MPASDGDAWWFEVDGRELRLSNLNKIFWPDEGYTKGDLIAYYLNVAAPDVPHLAERPLTMKRMPDGIDGHFFYEKSAPSHVPDWIGRCPVAAPTTPKTGVIDYMTIEDTAGLLYIANLGCIEFHPLHSRCDDVAHPDYLFFDLDPFPPYTYEDVLTVARHIKVLLDQLGLTAFPKTSRRHGSADLPAGRTRRVHLRAGAGVRRRVRPPDHAGRPRPRDDGVEDRRSLRQDLHRPQHEPFGREHLRGVLAPTRAARSRFDAAHVGRGVRRGVRAAGLPDRQRVGALRARRRPVRGRAHRGDGPHERVRGAGSNGRRRRRRLEGRRRERPRRSSRPRRTRSSPSTSASETSKAPRSRRPASRRARATRS